MASTTISTALVPAAGSGITTGTTPVLVPWRDPQTVPAAELATYIRQLESLCLAEPRSANLRTCLGMAYAMDYQVDKSMDSLEEAVTLDPGNFWAQVKFAELHYRLRALNRAEDETLKALAMASDGWQLSIARKQLHEIRSLKQGSVRNVQWSKPLTGPALVLSLMLLTIFVVMTWK